jgi:hypothetical protein
MPRKKKAAFTSANFTLSEREAAKLILKDPKASLDEKLAALKTRAIDDFSRPCLEGARRALAAAANALRLNFFAMATRIMFEHMMDTLAPEEAVVRSEWYKPERENGKPTRGQRIIFAIQGELSEVFVTHSSTSIRAHYVSAYGQRLTTAANTSMPAKFFTRSDYALRRRQPSASREAEVRGWRLLARRPSSGDAGWVVF